MSAILALSPAVFQTTAPSRRRLHRHSGRRLAGGRPVPFRESQEAGEIWPKARITPSRNTEGLIHVDVDGDGIKDLIPSHYSEQPVFWVRVKKDGFERRAVGPRGNGHGVGLGDVDGDGKKDICAGKTGQYWFENLTVSRVSWQERELLFNRYPVRR